MPRTCNPVCRIRSGSVVQTLIEADVYGVLWAVGLAVAFATSFAQFPICMTTVDVVVI